MPLVEVFVHAGCKSERTALALADEIRREFPSWQVLIRDCEEDRARVLGILIAPSFVLNGELIAVGIPRKEWLIRALCEARTAQNPMVRKLP
ncbi:hypothetical protein [Nitrospira sp. Kam-Ns4a]